jgi:L-aminopeptidase/D-esterase-like protein
VSGRVLPRLRVRGLTVGCASDPAQRTGVTVLRFGGPARTVVDVRGGASATYDTASLALDATYGGRWAIFFAGGSVFGLDAARGVRDAILADGGGHRAFRHPRAIAPVSGACLFDLPQDAGPLPDYALLGRTATESAKERVRIGRCGAGTGATVGKYRGRPSASPGGQGFSQGRVSGLGNVAVVAVVNSVGAIVDPRSSRWVEGARFRGRIVPPIAGRRPAVAAAPVARGTNLVAVVTDAALDRPGLQRVAILAQSGLARCVVPSHTSTDGDVAFASSTSTEGPGPSRYPGEIADTLGELASELVVSAVLSAVGR